MQNKELIKILSDFNPLAEVFFNYNGIEKPIELYGWDVGGDSAEPTTQVERDREKARRVKSIYFCYTDNNNKEC